MILTLIFSANYYAQCTGCTVTNPVLSGNYTFASGSTVCFTSNATLADVTFLNNSKICVAPGVTVTIQNNVTSTSGNNVTLEIGGTLQFNNPPTFNANLNVNVQSTGILKSGSTGNSNFTFNGTTNNLTNNGTVQVSVLGFNNSSSTNIIDNYGTLTIGSNINISGSSTTFRNWNLINIGQSFNMNSSTTYINCGTINTSTGFNVGGGRIINTGNFTVSTSGSGNLDLPNGSRFENYGILDSRATTNNNGTTSIIYNEGLVKFNTYQGDGWLRGPSSATKKGYFEVASQLLNNSAKVGPNLDFKRTNTTSSQTTVFNATPTYVTSTGTTTTQTGANVTYDCRAAGNCSAPLVTNIGLCPNIDGTFPPQANDDNYTIAAGSSATTNVLVNDFAVYNGAAATTSNVTVSQVSTTNTGVTINSSGIVSVAAGTPAGSYTLVYRICNTTNPTSCDTATVTVKVPLDSDVDGVPNVSDLDDDNDGILDLNELCPPISGATTPQADKITWSLNGLDIYTIGGNTNGLGYKESGFEQAAYNQGKNLTTLNGTDNFTFTGGTTQGSAINSTGTFTNGTLKYYSNHPVNGRAVFRDTTADSFISGTTGDGIYLEPEVGLTAGQIYDVEMNFTTPVTAFSFDILDAFDTMTTNNPVIKYSIIADGETIAYLQGNLVGNDLTGNISIYDANGTLKGNLQVGQNIETTIGFVTLIPVKKIIIRHEVITNKFDTNIHDPHGFDGISYSTNFCDTDGDGIANHLDLDSDGDGCSDAAEGDENVLYQQITSGKINGSVDANGVPILVNTSGAADIGSDQGQGAGSSTNLATVDCKCNLAAQKTGTELNSNHGITALGRAGNDNGNWPMERKGAWTVLEAKTKGFVVNRLNNAEVLGIPAADLREGMMVYNTTLDCLQINIDGTASGWRCYNTQTCPDL